jgi:hypothetical protein
MTSPATAIKTEIRKLIDLQIQVFGHISMSLMGQARAGLATVMSMCVDTLSEVFERTLRPSAVQARLVPGKRARIQATLILACFPKTDAMPTYRSQSSRKQG